MNPALVFGVGVCVGAAVVSAIVLAVDLWTRPEQSEHYVAGYQQAMRDTTDRIAQLKEATR